MSLITAITDPLEALDMNIFASRRIHIEDYPNITKEDLQEVMESYITDCLATSVVLVAYSFNEIPDNTLDVYSLNRKSKPKSTSDEPYGISKPPAKMA